MTHKKMTPTTTFSPMKGKEYFAPYHPTTMPGKSTIPIVDIFSEEAPNNEFPSKKDLMRTEVIKCLTLAVSAVGVVSTHFLISQYPEVGFGKYYESLVELYNEKIDIHFSDRVKFSEFIHQKRINLLNNYSLKPAEYASRSIALDYYQKKQEGLQDTALNAVSFIRDQATNEAEKSLEFSNKIFWIYESVLLVVAGSVVAMLAVHYFSGKPVMEFLSDTIDQVSAGASSVAQTMGDAMELASETMDRWLAGANDYSEYEFELDGAATDVAGADCPVFIEDALLADGAVPELIVYPHSIAL